MTVPIYPAQWWLTVAQVCADLRITAGELADWAASGQAPVPEVGPDGIARIHRADFQAWIDSMTVYPGSEDIDE